MSRWMKLREWMYSTREIYRERECQLCSWCALGGLTHELVCQQKNSLKRELAVAEVEKVFKRGTKEV